ncbi:ladderlectin-like [Puntigrus tetrazona]|uniref:ladderlectin-like n=1 Tax=Puntigrus tetrazona TaxID=1606681 RepID=UPI001C8ABBF8|nr:ladderlectin-like [Puntigrus tetrazona]
MAMLRSLLLFMAFSVRNALGHPDIGHLDPVDDEKCQDGWTNFEVRCYKFFPQASNWISAEKSCIGQHANLASVHTEQENDFLLSLLPSSSTRCWIGVQDAVQEGEWLWSDGTAYTFTNWCPNEPNNLNGENCGEINWTSKRCWNDAGCTNSMGYICSKKSS